MQVLQCQLIATRIKRDKHDQGKGLVSSFVYWRDENIRHCSSSIPLLWRLIGGIQNLVISETHQDAMCSSCKLVCLVLSWTQNAFFGGVLDSCKANPLPRL